MEEQSKSYIDVCGFKLWYLPSRGKDYIHRIDGHAVEWSDGHKEWWIDCKQHRLDGPAIIYSDGTKAWYINDKLHRLDGPAVEDADGTKEWYIDGNELSTKEVETWIKKNKIDLKTEAGQVAFKLRWT